MTQIKTETGYYVCTKTLTLEAWQGSHATVTKTIPNNNPTYMTISRGNYLKLKTMKRNGECIKPDVSRLMYEAAGVKPETKVPDEFENSAEKIEAKVFDELDFLSDIEPDSDFDIDDLLGPSSVELKSHDFSDIDIPEGGFKIIYADPPWDYKDSGRPRTGVNRHYKTTDIEVIKKLPVKDICAKQSMVFMWVTYPFLAEALDLIKSWGFKYKTGGFTWIKENKVADTLFMGAGHYTRANAELCLIGTRGRTMKRLDKSVMQTQVHKLEEHSKKPDAFAESIVKLYGDKVARLEMFARDAKPGWASWGDEVGFIPAAITDDEEDVDLSFLE